MAVFAELEREGMIAEPGGAMEKLKFLAACIVGSCAVLIVLVLNRFEWGRRINGWALKI